MYAEAEINVEDIESEIGSGSHAVAQILPVLRLVLIAQIESEHPEREIERHILHDENTYTG